MDDKNESEISKEGEEEKNHDSEEWNESNAEVDDFARPLSERAYIIGGRHWLVDIYFKVSTGLLSDLDLEVCFRNSKYSSQRNLLFKYDK